MSDYYVYILFHPISFQPFYVGKGRRARINAHKSDFRGNPEKAAIMREANEKGLEVPAIKVRMGLSEIDAFRTEEAFIKAIGRHPEGPLVNRSDGRGGGVLRGEAKVKFSEKMSKIVKGRKHSPETIEKMRLAARAKTDHSNLSSPKNPQRVKGRKDSPEVIEKRRKKLLGKKKPEGFSKKISEILSGRVPPPQVKEGHKKYFDKLRASRIKDCPECGVSFSPNRKAQIFCGKRCSSKDNARRRFSVIESHC